MNIFRSWNIAAMSHTTDLRILIKVRYCKKKTPLFFVIDESGPNFLSFFYSFTYVVTYKCAVDRKWTEVNNNDFIPPCYPGNNYVFNIILYLCICTTVIFQFL